jgi:lipopolysaccharide biosynthesis regulator YciM
VGAALVLLLVALGALAAGVLIGRYYVPDDRQLRRTARHGRAYMRALAHHIARDHATVVNELRGVVEENVEDVEPYFALGALFRSGGEHERAIRVHQALALRERNQRKLRVRALYELGLDFRAAGMPRRATKALEEVLLEDPSHAGALRAVAALYEEQARFRDAAAMWDRLGKRRGEDLSAREHHLFVAAAQAALADGELDAAKSALKSAKKLAETPHFFVAAAELAAARGNPKGARERLKQALVADPALAPHVLPGLIAAETALAGGAAGQADDDLDESTTDLAALPAGASGALPAGASESLALAAALPATTAIVPRDPAASAPGTFALVPSARASATVADRVLATLAEIEAQTGPRLELTLIRAQLVPAGDADAAKRIAADLVARFPGAIAARVAAARLVLAAGDAAQVRAELDGFVSDSGQLAWALRGRWQCASCGNRPEAFRWRCPQCRRWATLHMETGVEPPPQPPRDRRAAVRARPDLGGLLGATPDESLPGATLAGAPAPGDDLAPPRGSLLRRMGGWFRRR